MNITTALLMILTHLVAVVLGAGIYHFATFKSKFTIEPILKNPDEDGKFETMSAADVATRKQRTT